MMFHLPSEVAQRRPHVVLPREAALLACFLSDRAGRTCWILPLHRCSGAAFEARPGPSASQPSWTPSLLSICRMLAATWQASPGVRLHEVLDGSARADNSVTAPWQSEHSRIKPSLTECPAMPPMPCDRSVAGSVLPSPGPRLDGGRASLAVGTHVDVVFVSSSPSCRWRCACLTLSVAARAAVAGARRSSAAARWFGPTLCDDLFRSTWGRALLPSSRLSCRCRSGRGRQGSRCSSVAESNLVPFQRMPIWRARIVLRSTARLAEVVDQVLLAMNAGSITSDAEETPSHFQCAVVITSSPILPSQFRHWVARV